MSFSDQTHRASEESLATVETVRSILSSKGGDVWWVAPSATVYDAIAMMADKRVGALLVLDGERLAGIISERDYARKVFLKGHSSRDTLVREIMTPEVITAEPMFTVLQCMRVMTAHRVRHLPVVEQGRVVGMISIGDLVNSIISAQAETIQHLRSYVTGEYPR
jgi:signal-transduction protein with cAMP-binding, CBS, and nucleotidyltransferase domain